MSLFLHFHRCRYMKSLWIILALLVVSAPAAIARGDASPSTVTVSGEGVVTRSPDVATLNVSIETSSDSASAAVSENNTKFNELKSRMRALSVRESDIHAAAYNVNYTPPPPPASPEPGAMRPIPYPNGQRSGYVATRSIDIKLRNVNIAGKAIDASIAAGVTNVNGVSFSVSDQRAAHAAALHAAVDDAHNQARAMAAAVHMRILRLRSMQSGDSSGPIFMRSAVADTMAAPMPASVPTVVKPENLQVRASVTVVYELGP